MTVTIAVNVAPTASLTYDGLDDRRPITRHTSVMMHASGAAPRPCHLYDLLVHAGSLLLVYAADEKHWLADLLPVAEQPPAPPTRDPSSRPLSTGCARVVAWQKSAPLVGQRMCHGCGTGHGELTKE
jgi:hypothetical protein